MRFWYDELSRIFRFSSWHAFVFHLGAETGVEFAGEGVVVERHGDLHVAEDGIVGEHVFEVDRNDGREPAVAMHDGRVPAQFLDRFEHAAREEDGALVVVGEHPASSESTALRAK